MVSLPPGSHALGGPDTDANSIGDMVYFKLLGRSFLILGSLERTSDLFEKRSPNYSDRPLNIMLSELWVIWFL